MSKTAPLHPPGSGYYAVGVEFYIFRRDALNGSWELIKVVPLEDRDRPVRHETLLRDGRGGELVMVEAADEAQASRALEHAVGRLREG